MKKKKKKLCPSLCYPATSEREPNKPLVFNWFTNTEALKPKKSFLYGVGCCFVKGASLSYQSPSIGRDKKKVERMRRVTDYTGEKSYKVKKKKKKKKKNDDGCSSTFQKN